MAQYTKILNAGTQASYDALETKNTNLLYFCTDTGKLYKGDVDFTNSLVAAASKPEKPVAGKIYFLADTNTVESYVNGAWKVLSYPVATTVDVSSDDVHAVSAKAVYDAIQAAVDGLAKEADVVTNVSASAVSGALSITKNGKANDVTISGVVTTPTWDASTRKLTLPVTNGANVEVEIGKDIYIDPTAQNGYNKETNTIDIYLNDGDTATSKEPTKVSIPVEALVSDYTGSEDTSGAIQVTVDENHKISASIMVSPDGGLTIDPHGMLQVDFSTVNNSINEVDRKVNNLQIDHNALKDEYEATADTVTALEGPEGIYTEESGQINSVKTTAKHYADDALQQAKNYADDAAKYTGSESTSGAIEVTVEEDKSISAILLVDEANGYLGVEEGLLTFKGATELNQNALRLSAVENDVEALASATTEWGSF